jgi:phage terminase large subunit GpA-like protein
VGRDRLDGLARSVVMARAGAALTVDERGRWSWWGRCQHCGKESWLSWCHLFTRGAYSVRWDPEAAFAWCSGCHRHLDQHWETKRAWAIDRLGEDKYRKLELKKRAGTRPDYGGWLVYLLHEWRPLSRGLAEEQRGRFG